VNHFYVKFKHRHYIKKLWLTADWFKEMKADPTFTILAVVGAFSNRQRDDLIDKGVFK